MTDQASARDRIAALAAEHGWRELFGGCAYTTIPIDPSHLAAPGRASQHSFRKPGPNPYRRSHLRDRACLPRDRPLRFAKMKHIRIIARHLVGQK